MKTNLLIKTSIYAVLLFMCSFSNAQSNDWQLMKTQNGIEVYSRIISCETEGYNLPLENIVFKVINTTSNQSQVKLEFEIYFEEGCNGCYHPGEASAELTLNSGESVESTCSNFNSLNTFTVSNPNFEGSWKYTSSIVKIQTVN